MLAEEIMAESTDWFCVWSQPKHEHIAAAHLQKMAEVEVFLPRIRFQRATRQGKVWVTEALFPNYLFARFDWNLSLRQVQAARGVVGVIHFGEHWPVIPAAIIDELRQVIGTAAVHTIASRFMPGDNVEIAEGAMRGLRAVVLRVMPGRDRVAVLMEFLGRLTEVEIPENSLIREGGARSRAFCGPLASSA